MSKHGAALLAGFLGACALCSCTAGDSGPRTDRFAGVATQPVSRGSPASGSGSTSQALHSGQTYSTPHSVIVEATTPTAISDLLLPDEAAAAPDRNINPLTGLPAGDPWLLERRPLAIKISNYPRDIRPQFGLNEADVVFEYYIEWLNTRFIGIFYGNDASQIGPVRSGRYFDEHITRMYHAYYVFNFADPREYSYFLGSDLRSYMVSPGSDAATCPPFLYYDASSRVVDSSHYERYFDSTRFSDCLERKGADNARQDLDEGNFLLMPPLGSPAVTRIYTHYSRCDYNYWEWDPGTARYLRYQETSPSKDPQYLNDCADDPETYAPLVDALTREQVAADNVIVLFVPHTFASQDEEDHEIYHIDLVDAGRAYVFRDGFGLPARWFRNDVDQPLQITTPTGDPLPLRPGRTFYQVIGQTSDSWSDGLRWHFDFHTP